MRLPEMFRWAAALLTVAPAAVRLSICSWAVVMWAPPLLAPTQAHP